MTKLTKLGKANKKQLYQWLDEQGLKKAFITNLRLRTKRQGKESRDRWEEYYSLSLNLYYQNPIASAFAWYSTGSKDDDGYIRLKNTRYWQSIHDNYDRYLKSLFKDYSKC